jgi:hypothetical protein
MKKILLLLILSSCSASYHYNKAIKKDPSIVKNDTTIVEKIIEGATVGEDSVEINNDLIWIKAIGLGKISLDYKVKTKIVTDVTTVDPPKNNRTERVRLRQEGRTDRKQLKQDAKTARTQIRYKYKTIKVTEKRNDLLYIGIAIGLAISYLVYRATKQFFG